MTRAAAAGTPGALAAGALLLSLPAGRAVPAAAAPQTFDTALPVAKGEVVFRQQFVFRKAGDDPSPSDRNLEALGSISVLGYGATGDLALFGAVPFLDKRLESTDTGGTRMARSSRGPGDVRLFGRYTALRDDAKGRTFRIAPFAGIEMPTGDDDDRDSFGTLPATVQPGSGSWDPFAGVVATWQTLGYQIDAQASYQFNTRANGFEFGDEFRLDASLQYRLWPRSLGSGVPGFLYGVLESNLVRQGRNRSGGTDDRDSGGTSLFLSPGLQYVTRRWVAEAIVQLPAFQRLGGTALEDDFTVRTGFRVNF
jgi:hypothetical protein